jgi:HK97 family phage major capsid protein
MAADGGVDLTRDIKDEKDAVKVIKDVQTFCRENAANIEKVPGLQKAVADLTAAMEVLKREDQKALYGDPAERAGGTMADLVKEYRVHGDEPVTHSRERDAGIRLVGKSIEVGDTGREARFIPGILDGEPVNEVQAELQKAWTVRSIVRHIQAGINGPGRFATPILDRQIQNHIKAMPAEVQKAFADATGVGAEWIPDEMLPMLETTVRHERQVAGLFQEIPVTRETALLPYLSAGFTPFIHGNVNTDDYARIRSSSPVTTQRSISVKNLAVRAQISEDAAEDTLIGFVENSLLPEGVFALVSGEEDAIINGDTTASHADTALADWNPDSFWPAAPGGLSIDHRRLCIGLRHRAGDVSNTTDRATFSASTFATDMATLMGPKQGPRDAVAIVNNTILATKIFPLSEVVTREKYGDGAAILTGEVGRLYGRPLIPSQFLTADLNASGVFDNVTTTKSGLLQVLRGRFKLFVRRGISMEIVRDPMSGVRHLIWKKRFMFATVDAASTGKNVHYAYNMA